MTQATNLEHVSTRSLRKYRANARTHSKEQITQIARSITEFGFTNPVLVDDDLRILAGHGRVAAAKVLGLLTVPIVRLSARPVSMMNAAFLVASCARTARRKPSPSSLGMLKSDTRDRSARWSR